jgi:hypothetical protein
LENSRRLSCEPLEPEGIEAVVSTKHVDLRGETMATWELPVINLLRDGAGFGKTHPPWSHLWRDTSVVGTVIFRIAEHMSMILQLRDLRHHLGAEQAQRTQRLGERHRTEEKVGEQIINSEFDRLALELGLHGLRTACDN